MLSFKKFKNSKSLKFLAVCFTFIISLSCLFSPTLAYATNKIEHVSNMYGVLSKDEVRDIEDEIMLNNSKVSKKHIDGFKPLLYAYVGTGEDFNYADESDNFDILLLRKIPANACVITFHINIHRSGVRCGNLVKTRLIRTLAEKGNILSDDVKDELRAHNYGKAMVKAVDNAMDIINNKGEVSNTSDVDMRIFNSYLAALSPYISFIAIAAATVIAQCFIFFKRNGKKRRIMEAVSNIGNVVPSSFLKLYYTDNNKKENWTNLIAYTMLTNDKFKHTTEKYNDGDGLSSECGLKNTAESCAKYLYDTTPDGLKADVLSYLIDKHPESVSKLDDLVEKVKNDKSHYNDDFKDTKMPEIINSAILSYKYDGKVQELFDKAADNLRDDYNKFVKNNEKVYNNLGNYDNVIENIKKRNISIYNNINLVTDDEKKTEHRILTFIKNNIKIFIALEAANKYLKFTANQKKKYFSTALYLNDFVNRFMNEDNMNKTFVNFDVKKTGDKLFEIFNKNYKGAVEIDKDNAPIRKVNRGKEHDVEYCSNIGQWGGLTDVNYNVYYNLEDNDYSSDYYDDYDFVAPIVYSDLNGYSYDDYGAGDTYDDNGGSDDFYSDNSYNADDSGSSVSWDDTGESDSWSDDYSGSSSSWDDSGSDSWSSSDSDFGGFDFSGGSDSW